MDLYIKPMSFEQFSRLYENLTSHGYWCLNAEDPKEVFSYFITKIAVRFAKKGRAIPNFEVKFPKKPLDEASFRDTITVTVGGHKLIISSLGGQVAFKRYYLGSDKEWSSQQKDFIDSLVKN
ncbi:MAG TPA: hypothetical protein VJH97_03820 [Candidatus Nanoarchaeia archaeon]|nr:hypothetical protein [Candidatus Nanoarchaeia archaeon]